MRRLLIFVLAFVLCGVCTTALGQDATALEGEYSHIQDLNNAGSAVVYAKSPTAAQLRKAIAGLERAQTQIAKLRMKLAIGSQLGGDARERQEDNLRYRADAWAQLGDKQKALDCLDEWAAGPVGDWGRHWLATDKYLAGLRSEPRFKALVARLDAVASRWNADALVASSAQLSEAQRIAGLSLFWSEARYNFAYFDLVPKLDWNQTYLDFLPKVIAAKNLHDYYDVLMRLAPLLHDSHTDIYPPESIQDQFYARPVIHTALVQGRVIVTWIADPRIEIQGLHIGDEIVSIDGEEVHRYAREHVEPYMSSSTPQDLAVRMYTYHLLMGDHAKSVVLGFKNAAGKLRSITLSREPDPAAKWPAEFEFRMLPGDIAYLKLGEFEDGRGAKAFEQHLPEILKAKGLILDVRDNGGGSSTNGYDVLAWLSDKPIPEEAASSREYVPVYRAWNGPSETWKSLGGGSYSKPRHRHYGGPVVVLMGPRTISAAEDFVVSFEAMKRGLLIGRKTAGSTGQPLMLKLPGGGFARICTLRNTFPDGRSFVGIGIPPQIEVEPTVADIRAGRDPAIAAATKALLAKSAQH